MAYVVKEADLERDRQTMVEILERNRTREDTDYQKRFDWIYLNNPFGRAKAWIIYREEDRLPVGFTGVFPRPVFVNGKAYLAWNCGDFSIDTKFRTLGVAVKLRRAAKDGVDSGEVPFLYAHPNRRMEVIHFRVGHKKISQMVRFALPLKFNRYLKDKLKPPVLAELLSLPVNLSVKMRFALKRQKGFKGLINDGIKCTTEHEKLFESMKQQFAVIGTRSCKFLQWKFADHPNFKYRQFDFFQGNQLKGSLFFLLKNDTVHLIDVLIEDWQNLAAPLFLEFIAQVYAYRLGSSLSFIIQENNPLIEVMKAVGFRQRDDATSSVIAYASEEKQPELANVILNGANWFMTVGDRDA